MDLKRKKKLQANGWKSGNASDFLGLTKEEAELIELKISLSRLLQESRKRKHITQTKLAELISSSQSRVAKMEKSDPSVSLDLIVRSLFAMGVTKTELRKAIA
jgi:DNA-binding XRE family transcriptional regulator